MIFVNKECAVQPLQHFICLYKVLFCFHSTYTLKDFSHYLSKFYCFPSNLSDKKGFVCISNKTYFYAFYSLLSLYLTIQFIVWQLSDPHILQQEGSIWKIVIPFTICIYFQTVIRMANHGSLLRMMLSLALADLGYACIPPDFRIFNNVEGFHAEGYVIFFSRFSRKLWKLRTTLWSLQLAMASSFTTL